MITSMKAMEYNVWMTVLEHITSRVQAIGNTYLSGITIDIRPSYPKDITGLNKPAIIVQKITSKEKKIGLGNFIGQYYDEESNTLVDVSGKMYSAFFDFVILSSGNIERSLITDMFLDDILNITHLDLKDFTNPLNPVIGSLTLNDSDIDVTHLSTNSLEDYSVMILSKFSSIRHTVPSQDTVDLSKLIMWKQTITL